RRPASRSLVRCRRWYFSSGHCCNARRSPLPARSFRHKSSNDMAFPHPKSRKDKYGNKDKANKGSVVGNCFKRTINIPDYRNGKDEVNPAKNRTFDGATDHLTLSIFNTELLGILRVQPLPAAELHSFDASDAADGSSA